MRDLGERTKAFALRVIRICRAVPRTREGNVIASQLLRAGTSVGAHYRESLRSRSDAELISKIEGALQELDEADYWLELLGDSGIISSQRLLPIRTETNELISIFVTSAKKVKARKKPR